MAEISPVQVCHLRRICKSRHMLSFLGIRLELDRLYIWPIVPMADCENSRCWVLPIVYWISHIWRFDYGHNYNKVAQLRPPVRKMVTGSINWVQDNRILSFYHFSYWKLHTHDKKCLETRNVYRGGEKEGNFIRFYYHIQSKPGIMIVGPTRIAWSKTDASLSAWTVIKDRYRAEPWIVLHGWPIEPMARWIR